MFENPITFIYNLIRRRHSFKYLKFCCLLLKRRERENERKREREEEVRSDKLMTWSFFTTTTTII